MNDANITSKMTDMSSANTQITAKRPMRLSHPRSAQGRRWQNLVRLLTGVGLFLYTLTGGQSPVAAQSMPQGAANQSAGLAAISPQLQRELDEATEPVSFLIVLDDQVNVAALLRERQLERAPRTERAGAVYATLTERAVQSQQGLRRWLDARGVEYRAFYIVNMLEVRGDGRLAQALRQRSDVRRLLANPRIEQSHLEAAPALAGAAWRSGGESWYTVLSAGHTAPSTAALPYGITYTNADDVWALGYRGEGIVVASQDTGVQWDHPAIQPEYRGWDAEAGTAEHVYNWFDAWGLEGRPVNCESDAQVPCDDNGHGTHTVGTMLGDDTPNGGDILGMAPAAEWMGCRNMLRGVGTPASYTACFEFFLAPYPQDGDPMSDGRPELAPHIINNSWSCPPTEGCDADTLQQIVETVRAAGQMVVSSAGNSGTEGCGSVKDPIAIYDAAFSVGAHDADGNIASFSSRGPVTIDGSGRAKPDIAAPGVAVYSSYVNSTYRSLQGTSMAAPHAAGAAALLWSAVPELVGQLERTEEVLVKSAVAVPSAGCGEGGISTPNYTYGYGRLDALAAVELAQAPGSVTVNLENVQAVEGAEIQVILTDALTGYQYSNTATVSPGTGSTMQSVFDGVYAGDYLVSVEGSTTSFSDMPVAVALGGEPIVTLVGEMALYLPFMAQ